MLAIFQAVASFPALAEVPSSGDPSGGVGYADGKSTSSPAAVTNLNGSLVVSTQPESTPIAGDGEFTPRDCPPISDQAVIIAKIATANSGAPATQHPGLDLYVRDGTVAYMIRVHFGNRGDGTNGCLSFNECKDMTDLPYSYPVKTSLVKKLFAYLRQRKYCLGKFVSWGVPIFPWGAKGSNCGDAFVVAAMRLGIAAEAIPDMRQWIKDNDKGKWAFDRGRRRPTDEFFVNWHPDGSRRDFLKPD